ncbi:MAG: SRPBCC family protein [Flavobacteriaceae bacterium]|nr:SRPBCC family protein [Flavobacteriaceae bacterium]
MKLHTLHSIQKLPIPLEQAWDFLSNPANLSVITPPDMGFVIRSGADRKMYPGQIIHYWVSPIAGIKTQWVTEITHVQNLQFFVDEQRFGPYKMWHHKHFLKAVDGGVEMEDIIHYVIPFGFLGSVAHQLFIRKKLETIFEYRRLKLIELFGSFDN